MHFVDAYEKEHVPIPGDASSGFVRPMSRTSYKEALLSLGQSMKFIDNCIQCFEFNYENKLIYKINMSELFKTTPKSISTKKR